MTERGTGCVRGAREKKSGPEWPDLVDLARSKQSEQIGLRNIVTQHPWTRCCVFVHALTRLRGTSLHKTQIETCDTITRWDVRTVLNEVPCPLTRLICERVWLWKNLHGKTPAGNSIDERTGVKFGAHDVLLILNRHVFIFQYELLDYAISLSFRHRGAHSFLSSCSRKFYKLLFYWNDGMCPNLTYFSKEKALFCIVIYVKFSFVLKMHN